MGDTLKKFIIPGAEMAGGAASEVFAPGNPIGMGLIAQGVGGMGQAQSPMAGASSGGGPFSTGDISALTGGAGQLLSGMNKKPPTQAAPPSAQSHPTEIPMPPLIQQLKVGGESEMSQDSLKNILAQLMARKGR